MRSTYALAALTLPLSISATFNLYRGRDIDVLGKEVGLTHACVAALNQTLNCQDRFLELTLDQESYHWKPENLTAGCTANCTKDTAGWVKRVSAACSGKTMEYQGMYVNPAVLPLMHRYYYELACLQDQDNKWCLVESQEWVGSEIRRNAPDLCKTGHKEWDNDLCFEEGFDQFKVEPDDVRLSKLYDKSMVCSECFLKVFTQRLTSPLLRKSNFTDYLIDQHKDLESVCSTTMPYTTATATHFQGTVPLPTATAAMAKRAAIKEARVANCKGTVIQPPTSPMSCNALSKEFNVTTGDLTVLTDDIACRIEAPICAPLPCELMKIDTWNETCTSLRDKISTPQRNVTDIQFSDWNPRMIGFCDQVRGDQYICASPPGGHYQAPPPVHAPTSASAYYTTAIPPKPTSDGTTKSCGKYHDLTPGDTCQVIILQNGITLDTFLELNTQVKHDCSNLWIGYSYCVAPVSKGPAVKQSKAVSGLTEDGSCGPDHNNWICGGKWGDCCSIYGSCGSSSEYCGVGVCYGGKCDTETGGKSLDGSCGPNFAGNKTCAGTQFGSCCSKDGYCGDGDKYCSKENCHSGKCY